VDTKLIVGLGNPGDAYAETRHNAGRRLIEFIVSRHSIRFSKKTKLNAFVVSFSWEGHEVVLAYPDLFMNLSGAGVRKLVEHFSIVPGKNLLIAVDDVALPFGSLRLRSRGSDGGHNGLKSVNAELQNSGYARLRLGVGRQEKKDELLMPLEEYVLSPFSKTEKKQIPAFLERGYEACRLWISQTIDKAMNNVNSNQSIS
jgi:PTH1 family peptidyl-tRNA hydrolase